MEIEKILLKTYAEADEEQRLSMFLTHRGLRRHFTQVDMATATRPATSSSHSFFALSSWLSPQKLACYYRGCLKFCRLAK